MKAWRDVDASVEKVEAQGASEQRRKLIDLVRTTHLTPKLLTKFNHYMLFFEAPDGETVCVEHSLVRPNLWFGSRHAAILQDAGVDLEKKTMEGGRHSALNVAVAFGSEPAWGLKAPTAEQARIVFQTLGLLGNPALNSVVVDRWVAKLRAAFPNLDRFDAPDPDFDARERDYKLATARELKEALSAPSPDDKIARITKAISASNLLNWRAMAPLSASGSANRSIAGPALLKMAEAARDPEADHAEALAQFVAEWNEAVAGNHTDNARQIGEFLIMHLSPETGVYIRHTVREELWKEAVGERFPATPDIAETYRQELLFMKAVRAAFELRNLAPRDMIDVQSALWVVHNYKEEDMPDTLAGSAADLKSSPTKPLNTILYGPPGTGKTWETAKRAVEICDGQAPEDRQAVMARYHELCALHRIEFVTFHQSYGYEEFVEGLRPETGEARDGGSETGFRLVPKKGVLRRIADRARTPAAGNPEDFDLSGRNVFKMSLGRANDDEGEVVFRDSMDEGLALLGWGGSIDWSDARYDDAAEIGSRWREQPGESDKTNYDANISQMSAFRNDMQEGDIVLVSRGNSLIRAIGIVEGPYRFVARESDHYFHARPVRWMWEAAAGEDIAVDEIYDRPFTMRTFYKLKREGLDSRALSARLAPPQTEISPPHVLVIDEINRANISKVMGELITLLEEDKRAGAPNELAVTLPHSGDHFTLPANLHILGTMNTADRSIALLDTALRRRFRFEHLAPDPAVLAQWQRTARPDLEGLDLAALLRSMNSRIEWLLGPDHLIGHGWFMGVANGDDLDAIMARKVIPLLREYFHEDLGRVRSVLGGGDSFLRREPLSPPPGLDDGFAETRWRYVDRFDEQGFYEWSAYDEILGAPPRPEPDHLDEDAA